MGNIEVERRFLTIGSAWEILAEGEEIWQGYLNTDADRTVRVRVSGNKGYFTVKGRTVGDTKPEIESEIPVGKARAILTHPQGLCVGCPVVKTRFTISVVGLVWEVDRYGGENQGLVIAEVEYRGGEDGIEGWRRKVDEERPGWIGDEVSGDAKYFNSQLANHPFKLWRAVEKAPMLRHASAQGE